MKTSKTLLITGIGGDVAQSIATIVRETWPGWRLVGTDIHERHAGRLSVDAFHLAPRVSDSGYAPWLDALVRREHVDLCLPMSEAELIHLAAQRADGRGGVPLVMANPEAISVGADKLRTSEFLRDIGVAGPWTIPAERLTPDTPLPCIFKPRRSAGSKGIFLCRSVEEVTFYCERHEAAVLQELLLPADREVTCAVYRSQAGPTAVVQLLRSLVGGATSWAQVIDEPDVTAQCLQIAEALNLRGAINVQLRLTSGGPRVFEINPRFSSTVLIRHRMGFCDVVWSIQEALGQTITVRQPVPGTVGVRVQGAALIQSAAGGPDVS